MSDKNGRIIFFAAAFFLFFAFALYANFYRTTSFLIQASVKQALVWSVLLDRQNNK